MSLFRAFRRPQVPPVAQWPRRVEQPPRDDGPRQRRPESPVDIGHMRQRAAQERREHVNTTVVIVDAITRTVIELAFIGAGLKLALTVAPRFQIAAPKAPVQPQDKAKGRADIPKADAAEDTRTGPHPLEGAA